MVERMRIGLMSFAILLVAVGAAVSPDLAQAKVLSPSSPTLAQRAVAVGILSPGPNNVEAPYPSCGSQVQVSFVSSSDGFTTLGVLTTGFNFYGVVQLNYGSQTNGGGFNVAPGSHYNKWVVEGVPPMAGGLQVLDNGSIICGNDWYV